MENEQPVIEDEMAEMALAVGAATGGLHRLHSWLRAHGFNAKATEVRRMYERLMEIHDGPWPIVDGKLQRDNPREGQR
jgi:hypothetical protein